MIRRAFSGNDLSALPQKGVEAQKIRALLRAYGVKYDFCRFYVSESAAFCEMDGCFVICETGGSPDIEELADFLAFGGFSEIFCSAGLGAPLAKRLSCRSQRVSLMRFEGEAVPNAEVETNPPLDEVYEILKTAFDIEYEAWYADMSHRIRHGVAKARKLGNSALMIQHDINGEALLSQIVTLPGFRCRGNASRLIKAVCAELSESEVFLLCEDELVPFYEKLGFQKCSEKMILTQI